MENDDRVTVKSDALPPEKKYIAYVIPPTSTTISKEPINDPWDGATRLLVTMPSVMSPSNLTNLSTPSIPLLKSLHQPTSSQMIPYGPNIV